MGYLNNYLKIYMGPQIRWIIAWKKWELNIKNLFFKLFFVFLVEKSVQILNITKQDDIGNQTF